LGGNDFSLTNARVVEYLVAELNPLVVIAGSKNHSITHPLRGVSDFRAIDRRHEFVTRA
jgi:hypothetical protein